MPLKVLLCESASNASTSIRSDLLDRGYDLVEAQNPLKATSLAKATWPDLIVVHASADMVDVDEMCHALDRTRLDFPRLIISDDERCNHIPANAHLAIPFSPRQLTHRINKAIGTQCDRFLRAGDITLDQMKRQVQRNGHTEHLTPKELKLLRLLMQHAGEVVNRRTIMNEVWETDFLDDTRTLDVHIRWLREKLEDNPSRPTYIITVRGVGYRFHIPEANK